MKKTFPTLWTNKQGGFIALPILALILLGTAVVGGGGYTVYKVNQMEQRNAEVVAELEAKLEQVATTTQETVVETTTSTEIATTTEDVATSTDVSTEPEPQAKPAQVYTPTPVPVTVPVVYTPTVVDVCSNIAGVQSVIPEGYRSSGTTCDKREDKCSNIEGIQDDIPNGMLAFKGYGCMTEREMEKIEESEREAEELAEMCTGLKDDVYEYDKKVSEIQEEYANMIDEEYHREGVSTDAMIGNVNRLKKELELEITPIIIKRDSIANEYNYKCL